MMSDKKKGKVLVIGGGVAGMTAAIQLGKMGHEVHIIEREPSLGGLVAKLGVAPEGHEPHASLLEKLKQDVESDDKIKVHLSTKLVGFSGKVQAFKAEVESSDGKKTQLDVGAVPDGSLREGRAPEVPLGGGRGPRRRQVLDGYRPRGRWAGVGVREGAHLYLVQVQVGAPGGVHLELGEL